MLYEALHCPSTLHRRSTIINARTKCFYLLPKSKIPHTKVDNEVQDFFFLNNCTRLKKMYAFEYLSLNLNFHLEFLSRFVKF